MGPLISVVIPTYNHAHFLDKALQSVRQQTYTNWEALVVDNHSQDNTDEVIAALDDPRIRLLKIHNDGVIAASRNLGIREARGEWIAFLDSDDCWYPAKLETFARVRAEDPTCDVVSNDELRVDRETGGTTILRHGPNEEPFYQALLLGGNRLSTSATVVRKAFLVRHRLAFSERRDHVTVEDYGLWLELARLGARFTFVPEVLGEFVIHGANNSAQLARHLANAEALLRDHVFTIQQFAQVPSELWQHVSVRLTVGRLRHDIAERRYLAAIAAGLRAALTAPIATAQYLAHKAVRR